MMTRKDLILEAFAYRRHTGATLRDIRTYAQFRQERSYTLKEDRAVLTALVNTDIIYTVGKKCFFTPAGYKIAKGRALRPKWEDSDAWIFQSLLCYSKNSVLQLPEIIAAADFINHAIPMAEEMHGSINRLLAGGLIRMKRKGFIVTERGFGLLSKVKKYSKRTVLDHLEGLGHILKCPCCGFRLKAIRWRFRMDDAEYSRAVAAYHEMWRAQLKRKR